MIAVIGATGNTGRAVVDELRRLGEDPVCVVRDMKKAQQVLGTEARSVVAELTDRAALEGALSGVERSVSRKHQGTYPALIVADTLRLFGQGTKVAVECAAMAADAGTLTGGWIVAIGGSGRGSDTALVMTPGHAAQLFDQVKIHEIICKPRLC